MTAQNPGQAALDTMLNVLIEFAKTTGQVRTTP